MPAPMAVVAVPFHGGAVQRDQRGVVAEAAPGMGEQIAADVVQQRLGAVVGPPRHPLRQRIEPAPGVPRLHHAVGVEQQGVTGLEGEDVQGVLHGRRQPLHTERRRGVQARHRHHVPGAQQQRRRMPAAGHPGDLVPVRDLHQQRGREPLARLVLRLQIRRVPGDALLQRVDQVLQRVMPVGTLPERAEQQRGLPDGGQALAADVPDQNPYGVVAHGRRVEVAADLGLVLRGQVQGGDPQRADLLGQRPHQHVLRGLGDRADLGQLGLAPLAQGAVEDHQHREHREGDDLHDVVRGADPAVRDADDDLRERGQRADGRGGPGAGEGRGQRGRDHQGGPEVDALRGLYVHHRDHHDEHDRQQQQRLRRVPESPFPRRPDRKSHAYQRAPGRDERPLAPWYAPHSHQGASLKPLRVAPKPLRAVPEPLLTGCPSSRRRVAPRHPGYPYGPRCPPGSPRVRRREGRAMSDRGEKTASARWPDVPEATGPRLATDGTQPRATEGVRPHAGEAAARTRCRPRPQGGCHGR
ncbi:protein of unknown function [Streptomyces murinus]